MFLQSSGVAGNHSPAIDSWEGGPTTSRGPDRMTQISKSRARQGTPLGRMRYVLLISTGLAAIVLGFLVLGWAS